MPVWMAEKLRFPKSPLKTLFEKIFHNWQGLRESVTNNFADKIFATPAQKKVSQTFFFRPSIPSTFYVNL